MNFLPVDDCSRYCAADNEWFDMRPPKGNTAIVTPGRPPCGKGRIARFLLLDKLSTFSQSLCDTGGMEVVSDIIKSKARVSAHGEVFTPAKLVQDMLKEVESDISRIDSKVLEPACGSGNFLVPSLKLKLAQVEKQYSKSEFELKHHALLAVMSIYGIELLEDNLAECIENLQLTFVTSFSGEQDSLLNGAVKTVLMCNIIQGDALNLKDLKSEPLVFPEWSYLGRGQFKRRDFKFEEILEMSEYTPDSLFDPTEVFSPLIDYEPLNLQQIAAGEFKNASKRQK